jgi:hypothetical protein
VYLFLPDHLREAYSQFSRTHGPCKGHHHFPACFDVQLIAFGGINKRCSVKMKKVRFNKRGNGCILTHGGSITRNAFFPGEISEKR